jgi:hypothetical protein
MVLQHNVSERLTAFSRLTASAGGRRKTRGARVLAIKAGRRPETWIVVWKVAPRTPLKRAGYLVCLMLYDGMSVG